MLLQHLHRDVRYALRWLRRSPGFTTVAILSLAIGIGFNTALFTIVDAVLFRPLPVDRPDRLVDIFTNSPDGDTYATSSYPDYLDLKAQNHVFTDIAAYSPIIAAVSAGDRSRMAFGEVVTGNFFPLLGITAEIGRTIVPGDDRPGAERVVVLSHGMWMRDFAGNPNAVGQTLRIHGQPYTIVGVAQRKYTGMVPILSAALWMPMAYVDEGEPGGMISVVPSPTGNTRLERRGTRWMFMKGRLKDGAADRQAVLVHRETRLQPHRRGVLKGAVGACEIQQSARAARGVVHVAHRRERHADHHVQLLTFGFDERLHEHVGRQVVRRQPDCHEAGRGQGADDRQRMS